MNSNGKRWAWALVGGIGLAGCKTAQTSSASDTPIRPDVTDIRPMPRLTTAAAPAAYAPPAYAPPLYDTSGLIPTAPQPLTEPVATVAAATVRPSPVMFTPTTPPPQRKAVAAHGHMHVVRRGETWFAIARTTYGDGAQWRRLAAANPAAAGKPLMAGQKLVLP